MEHSVDPQKPRRTRFSKSKTGCRTCRFVSYAAYGTGARHVKCDESPGSCRRCTSSGFKCEGYDLERLPQKRNPAGNTTLNDYRFKLLLPDKTSEERRFFNHFHSFTIPMMNGWLDHRMWNRLVVQMCQAEPALCHAVVAVSALQEVSETAGRAVWSDDMKNRTHRFALYQYTRSIEQLTTRMRSNDPTVRSMVLLCCLMFIAFELIRENWDQAIAHLHSGLQIMGAEKLDFHDLYQTFPAFDHEVEQSLAAAMVHLDLQCTNFGLSKTHAPLSLALLAEEHGRWPVSMDFESVQDAWFMRDRIFLQFCTFHGFCDTLSAVQIAANHTLLSKEQKKQQIQLVNFAQALDRLEEKCLQAGTMDERNRGSVEILRMHHIFVSIMIDTCLIKSAAVIREVFNGRFVEVVDAAERIAKRILEKAREAGPRPTLLMETAIITPLYFIVEKCCDLVLAERGLAILESWPHREGIWDSTLAAENARSTIKDVL
ncbi:hypothetical protein BDW59DRAFT_163478 [Aspergillus cavernicola]|uniref:Zn(2)-C6 fungal-type domain-containing protein n=1 Tax=Aspergillus cavernicola TaxID=176166 RepID=A0ABR4I7S3_9EURO